jgi:hypothetical protein
VQTDVFTTRLDTNGATKYQILIIITWNPTG